MIAVLGDIHANIWALQAVLQDTGSPRNQTRWLFPGTWRSAARDLPSA